MIAAGCVTAVFALAAFSISRYENRNDGSVGNAGRDEIAASILHQVLVAGGTSSSDALRQIRRTAGLGGRVTRDIDVASWAESFVRGSTEPQREWLLENAVKLVSLRNEPVPVLQYSALLDLSFA